MIYKIKDYLKEGFSVVEAKKLIAEKIRPKIAKKLLENEIVKMAQGYKKRTFKPDSITSISKKEPKFGLKQWYEAGIKDGNTIAKLEKAGINPAQVKVIQSILELK